MKLILFLLYSLFLVSCYGKDNGNFYLSYKNGSEIVVTQGGSPANTVGLEWFAKAFYNNTVNSTGWDVLEIISNSALPDELQAFHAGWIEGFLTQKHIYYHWYNTQKDSCNKISQTCKNVGKYLKQNYHWMAEMIKTNLNDPYWHQANLYYQQLYGLTFGYQTAVKDKHENLTYEDILLINYVTDIMSLTEQLSPKKEEKFIKKYGHCSVLIKLIPGYSDVYFAHNSWITYNFMNRVIKRYNFAFHTSRNSSNLIPGQSQAFSSYPGVITSIDDFYLINSGLFVTETTNNVYNMTIYKNNKPTGQVLESVRSLIANRLAKDGQSWSQYYSKMNSGTYNNQWMVIDLKKFRTGFEPGKGFLTVLEQMPGKIVSNDQTNHILAHSYWASYNIPFYKEIFDYSGYNFMEKNKGSFFSYKGCARGKIFERDHESVVDLESMIRMIRYNNYHTDSYSKCEKCNPEQNACMAIASRCDLNPINGSYPLRGLKFNAFGAIDAKIGSYSLFKKGEMVSVSGPTWNDKVPPFRWSTIQPNNASHIGQPDLWNFTPIKTSWLHPSKFDSQGDPTTVISKTHFKTIPPKFSHIHFYNHKHHTNK